MFNIYEKINEIVMTFRMELYNSIVFRKERIDFEVLIKKDGTRYYEDIEIKLFNIVDDKKVSKNEIEIFNEVKQKLMKFTLENQERLNIKSTLDALETQKEALEASAKTSAKLKFDVWNNNEKNLDKDGNIVIENLIGKGE